MKSSILLLAFAALAFSSCTSAYKSGQTPDDVYYSPVRERGEEYVVVDKKEDRSYQGSEDYYEDRYLRYRMRSPYRWSGLDDYYWNTPYAWHYGGYTSWYNPYSSYHCWNNYYNPYYGGIIITKPVYNYRPPSRPVAFNPGSYNSGSGNPRNIFSGSKYNSSNSRYNNRNSNSYNNSNRNTLGNSLRRAFSNGNSSSNRSDYSNSNNNNSSTPSRSYNPSSSSSSSSSSSGRSGGSSGGGGSVSRPGR